jgi:magnesium chelatase accessory protein
LLVSLNGALLPFRGVAGSIFAPMARVAASTSLIPRMFAWHARMDADMVRRLIRNTGSRITGVELEMYRRLARRPGHAAAALAMMAHWDLEALRIDLPELPVPLALLVGLRDRAVAPAEARRVRAILPDAQLVRFPSLGHVAHEEDPAAVARVILDLAAECVRQS